MINGGIINTVAAAAEFCTTNDSSFPIANTAYYKLDGDAIDSAGTHNGTPSNVTWGAGRFGPAAVFNGTSSSIILPSAITTLLGNKVFSVSLWVKDNGSVTDTVFSSGGANTFFLSANWVVAGNYSLDNGSGSGGVVLGAVTTNWSHIVLSSNGSSGIEAFLNGVSKGTLPYRNQDAAVTSIGNLRGGGFWFKGSIDQVRIFNTALTQAQVTELYEDEIECCTTDEKNYPVTNTAYYKLNGGTGTTVVDSKNTYNGTSSNVTYAAGQFDDAAVFNGNSSFIDTNTTFTPDLMSFSAWVKTNTISPSTAKQIISNRGGAGTNYLGIDVGITPNGNIYSRFDNGGSRGSTNSDTVSIPLNTWTHIAFTIDMSNSIQKVYKNGVFVYQETTSGSVASGNDFYIGKYFSGADYWEGSIDQVRIFNTALTQGQVAELYEEKQCGTSATLLANYTFNNTLASTGGTLGTLLKASASYQPGRFGNAITFLNGQTSSETSTFYGDIWTAMTRSNFTVGSVALWFKVSSINRRNIILYNEKCPWLSLELYANNQLYIGPGTNPIWSGTTFGTSDVVFACGTAERTGGTGNTQTVSATLYFGVAGGTLQSVSGSSTHTENLYTTTSCFGHGASSVGFGGWIDQSRFYDGVLTASEVQALYTE